MNSFIQYIQDGDFDNNEFHRVVNEVLIQGGKLESQTCTIPGEMAANEFENELEHEPGAISMARVGEDYNIRAKAACKCSDGKRLKPERA